MKIDPFKGYIQYSEPSNKAKEYAWHTEIGLQEVDGLKLSQYLINPASKNIEGKISIEEARMLLDNYCEENPAVNIEERT